VIPRKREMKKEAKDRLPRLRLEQQETDVPGFASLPTYSTNISYYFTNRVLGVKRSFIPVFIYHKSTSYYRKELRRLQERYKLGNIYIYNPQDEFVCLALKTMQRRRLQKVLNTSTSKTKHTFKKYKRIWVPFAMDLYDVIPHKYTGHLSRGHTMFVDSKKNIKKKKYCGWEKIELVRATYKKNG
jgi:hypothetical protein